jgi:hypothetical protein
MIIPVFDLWSIFWATLLDVIIDVIVFKLLKVRGITFGITILLNFLIPYLSFWFFIQSRPPLEEQFSALADFITNWMVNLVNFTISAVFGYIITAFIFIFSGGRTQEPEL